MEFKTKKELKKMDPKALKKLRSEALKEYRKWDKYYDLIDEIIECY